MGRIDRDELLRRVDLADLLDRLAPPTDRPVRRRWRCIHPDHEDRHPSVTMRVVDGIGRWRCWSCGRGGTAIDALIAAHGLTIAQAIEPLAARALPTPMDHKPIDDGPVPLHPSVSRYVEACHRILFTKTGRPVLEWLLNERRLGLDVLEANTVGADPGRVLLRRRRGLPWDGVAAVLPAFDPAGDLAYVQARYLYPDGGRKYGNPVARLGTNPRLAWVQTPISRPDLLIVCEGIIDALTAATAGLHAVAVLGATYPSIAVADTISDYAEGREVVVAFDGDDPGRIAASRLHDLLSARSVNCRVWHLPEGADLNGLAQTDTAWVDRLVEPVGVAT